MHRAGVTQVVGYSGPIRDDLSTAAETAFYATAARCLPTREAVRSARNALLSAPAAGAGALREGRPLPP